MDIEYKVERFEAELTMDELFEKFFDYDCTFSKCKECPAYRTTWSCPDFDFDTKDFLSKYSGFHMVVDRIYNTGAKSPEEAQKRLFKEKLRYDKELREMERDYKDGYGLAAQECAECGTCTRTLGLPCVHPDLMRYGPEPLGILAVDMVSEKLGFDVLWSDGESIPEYYVLAAGVLHN